MKELKIWFRLRNLVKGKVIFEYSGICSNLLGVVDTPLVFMRKYIQSWQYFSGCTAYPVPESKKEKEGYNKYVRAKINGSIWDFNTEYGQLRRDLCLHIMKELEKESKPCSLIAKIVGRGL